MTTILIVEDEERIASFLQRGLAKQGFEAVVAGTGEEAVRLARQGGIDLILLDLGLPDRDGVEVLAELREGGQTTPLIILTARDDVPSTVEGLEAGADEYVTKPFSVEDLISRIRNRLRIVEADGLLRANGIALDLVGGEAIVGARRVQLTRRESELLAVFLHRPDETLTKEEVLLAWAPEHPAPDAVDVTISYLQSKLGEGVIQSEFGTWYRLADVSSSG